MRLYEYATSYAHISALTISTLVSMSASDVDAIKRPIYAYQKSIATWQIKTFQFTYTHQILNVVRKVLKNHKPVHVKNGKCIFAPHGE